MSALLRLTLVNSRAGASPDAVAQCGDDRTLSYAELRRRSNVVAAHLHHRG